MKTNIYATICKIMDAGYNKETFLLISSIRKPVEFLGIPCEFTLDRCSKTIYCLFV